MNLLKKNKGENASNRRLLNIIDLQEITKNKSMEDIKRMIEDQFIWADDNFQSVTLSNSNKLSSVAYNNDSNVSLIDDPYEILNRRKYSKLTNKQIKFIKQQLVKNDNKISVVSQIYRISPSTVNRIKNTSDDIIENLPKRKFLKFNQKDETIIKDAIEKYCWSQEYPFTIYDIQQHLKETNNINCSYQAIRKILKSDLKFSYKRCLSRPVIADLNKVKLLRKLFSVQISKELNPAILIANWDEWSINKNTKLNYSWSRIGGNQEVKNASLVGSISVIMTIFSNGVWFVMLTNNTTNSYIFTHYLDKMNNWINNNNMFGYSSIYLMMDNWPYHKSKETTERLKNLNIKTIFLPPYSPTLAPIEIIFGWIKKRISKESLRSKLNLKSKEAPAIIFNIIKRIDKQLGIKTFRKFYMELKSNLSLS